jgi:hypothetical protein
MDGVFGIFMASLWLLWRDKAGAGINAGEGVACRVQEWRQQGVKKWIGRTLISHKEYISTGSGASLHTAPSSNPHTIPQPVIVHDDVLACIFDKVDGMRLALGPGLAFASVRMYQFFRPGCNSYQGRHLITEFISDVGLGDIFIFYSIVESPSSLVANNTI